MSENVELESIWPDFVKSADFKLIKTFPKDAIKEMLEVFFKQMSILGEDKIADWDVQNIKLSLGNLVNANSQDDSFEGKEDLVTSFLTLRCFLEFAGKDSRFNFSTDDLDMFIADLSEDEGINDLNGDKDDILKDYNEDNIDKKIEARDISKKWEDEYLASSNWKKRSVKVDEKIVNRTLIYLSRFSFDQYQKTPLEWTKESIEGIMTGRLVEDGFYDEAEYKEVVPVMSDLLDVVAAKGLLDKARANDYKKYMAAIEPKMLAMSQDPQNFSEQKIVILEQIRRGISTEDEVALDDFFNEMYRYGGVYELSGEVPPKRYDPSFSDDSEMFKFMLKSHDPDSTRKYLQKKHLKRNDTAQWSRKRAIANHKLGLKLSGSLLIKRKQYDFLKNASELIIFEDVTKIVDDFFAQYLETPLQWTVESWTKYSPQFKQERPFTGVKLLDCMLSMLTDKGDMTAETAQEIMKVVGDK